MGRSRAFDRLSAVSAETCAFLAAMTSDGSSDPLAMPVGPLSTETKGSLDFTTTSGEEEARPPFPFPIQRGMPASSSSGDGQMHAQQDDPRDRSPRRGEANEVFKQKRASSRELSQQRLARGGLTPGPMQAIEDVGTPRDRGTQLPATPPSSDWLMCSTGNSVTSGRPGSGPPVLPTAPVVHLPSQGLPPQVPINYEEEANKILRQMAASSADIASVVLPAYGGSLGASPFTPLPIQDQEQSEGTGAVPAEPAARAPTEYSRVQQLL